MTSGGYKLIFINVGAFSEDVNFQIIFNCKMGVSKNVFPLFFFEAVMSAEIYHTTLSEIAGLYARAEGRGHVALARLILQRR